MWGRYDLVLEPGNADLIMEIRLIDSSAYQARVPVFQVIISDPKTHAVLWVLNDYSKQEAARKAHRDRLFSERMELWWRI